MNKCILRVQGISSYDLPKEDKVLGFKNNHFFLRFQPINLTKLRIEVYTGYSLVLNFV